MRMFRWAQASTRTGSNSYSFHGFKASRSFGIWLCYVEGEEATNGGITMKIWKSVVSMWVLMGLFFAVGIAEAQTFDRGEVHGFVYDTTHRTVAKAKVSIFNPSTGYRRQ